MKKTCIILFAAFLFASCGNSSETRTTHDSSSTTTGGTGTDTTGGYNANSGDVNNNSSNTMKDSGSGRYHATDTAIHQH